MLSRILKKDFYRNKSITAALFVFIMLSVLLVSGASSVIMELIGSMNELFAKSNAPHFVQMHSGEIDEAALDAFVTGNSLIKDRQTVKMLGVDNSGIFLGDSRTAEVNSVMDIGFVRQNRSFDFLLNLENQIVQVSKGEIAVPVYYMQQKNMKIGDRVGISHGSFAMEFTVADFVRDVQMNPSIVSSKRFVVSDADFKVLEGMLDKVEYLIEFQLADQNRLNEFSSAYQASNLPKKGPAVDYHLFRLLNAMTDGIVAAVIILVSLLLIAIAILCLRFTILATMEEDYKEIGVMKAIGIEQRDISRIYLAKYVVMGALAAVSGYLLSLFVNRLLTANIALYMGTAHRSLLHRTVPLLAAGLIFLMIVSFCRSFLGKFRRITPVEALRPGNAVEGRAGWKPLTLHKSSFLGVNLFLGLEDVFGRFRVFGLLCFIFILCSFIIIVPVNFLNTLRSADFITYMGAGKSDVRIDLQQTDGVGQRFADMLSYIENDGDAEKFSPLVTCKFRVLGSDGVFENIHVETGDFSIFPLKYSTGAAPARGDEIALSYLSARELGKGVGDSLRLEAGGREREMSVSGIYQDVTNGGRTAKALLPYDAETVLWYVVNVDVKPGVDINDKIDEYAQAFYPAKVTHLEEYLSQTLGATISQLSLITVLAVVIAASVSVLITSLFLKMLIAKDSSQIAVLKSIGFSSGDIRAQYMVRTLFVLGIGIFLGTIASNTIGQSLIGIPGSFIGASRIEFVIDPAVSYLLCPAALMIIVAITTSVSAVSMKKYGIAESIAE